MESSEEITNEKRNTGRFGYCLVFIMTSIVAVIFGFTDPDQLLSKIPGMPSWFAGLELQTLAILRFSFALSVFFLVHALVMIGRQSPGDHREKFQYGWWIVKVPALIALCVAAFAIPAPFYQVFDYISRIGACFFLILQILILIDFAYSWNEAWVSYEKRIWYIAIVVCAVLLLAVAMTIIICLFIFYGGNGCELNNFFIAFTMILSIIVILGSIRAEHGALLPAAIISAYCAYVCWDAINGVYQHCNKLDAGGQQNIVMLLVGAAFAILSLVYQSFNASKSTEALTYNAMPKTSQGSDTYNYFFFHFVFFLASLYMGMLFTGWRNYDSTDVGTQSVGSMWVKIVSQWVVFALYGWSLIAPSVLKNRDFGYDM